jgi:hypothetical protein
MLVKYQKKKRNEQNHNHREKTAPPPNQGIKRGGPQDWIELKRGQVTWHVTGGGEGVIEWLGMARVTPGCPYQPMAPYYGTTWWEGREGLVKPQLLIGLHILIMSQRVSPSFRHPIEFNGSLVSRTPHSASIIWPRDHSCGWILQFTNILYTTMYIIERDIGTWWNIFTIT